MQGEICKDVSVQGLSIYLKTKHMTSIDSSAGEALPEASRLSPESGDSLNAGADTGNLVHPISAYARIGLTTGNMPISRKVSLLCIINPKWETPYICFTSSPCSSLVHAFTLTRYCAGSGQLSVLGQVKGVQVQIDGGQVAALARLADEAEVWQCRRKTAVFRPAGWRSSSTVKTPCR